MAMAVAIDTSLLALDIIPWMQRKLDGVGGEGRRFQIHRFSVYATILSDDSEIHRYLYPQNPLLGFSTDEAIEGPSTFLAKQEAVEWQADPDDDLGDTAVLHHLQQQAATIPLLASAISQSDRANSATTLIGTALSPSINARTQGRPLSSFLRYSSRLSDLALPVPISDTDGVTRETHMAELFPYGGQDRTLFYPPFFFLDDLIVWAGPKRDNHLVFLQVQVDLIDLGSRRRPTYQPRKRRRTSVNQFLQLSQSPVVEDSARRNPLPHAKRFNGVRYRKDRNIWVAEMKPTKHKTKQDFGNFKSEDEAARAVDAAFHHYGRPDLLNFPHTSLQFLSTRPTAPAGLDEKAKVKFVKEEAKLLLAAMIAASSPLHSTHTNSLQMLSPRRFPSGPFRSLSEISSPFSCSGPYEVDAVVSQPQPRMLHDSMCDISTTGVPINVETLNSEQHAEQGWDWAEDSCPLAVPLNVVDPSAPESPSMFPESIIRWSPAPTYPRSPSPSHFREEISYNLWAHQSI